MKKRGRWLCLGVIVLSFCAWVESGAINATENQTASIQLGRTQISVTQTAIAIHTTDSGRRALQLPMAGLDASQRQQFGLGRSLFNQMWIVAPARDAVADKTLVDSDVDGLGPLFNRLSCAACHPGNGRGRAPDGPREEMRSMLVRLSVPGSDPHGGSLPHPLLGDQLNEQGIPGIAGEGVARISYTTESVELRGGDVVELRRPHVVLETPLRGENEIILTSLRVAPAIVGMGLLEAIPEHDILAWADPDDRDGDGISGRPNRVWDLVQQRQVLGRFGLKANVAGLRRQIAAAFAGDLGITTALFPAGNCMTPACLAMPDGGSPELTDRQLDDVLFYHQTLAVPSPRNTASPDVMRGQQQFDAAGCARCHWPELITAQQAQPDFLAGRVIHPYTDLLLHDMGDDLAEHRPDFQASGREWRTAPLWGIGLAETVGDKVSYLHDGRARTLLEAVLWHGGEAAASRAAVVDMDPAQRNDLLAFLRSL